MLINSDPPNVSQTSLEFMREVSKDTPSMDTLRALLDQYLAHRLDVLGPLKPVTVIGPEALAFYLLEGSWGVSVDTLFFPGSGLSLAKYKLGPTMGFGREFNFPEYEIVLHMMEGTLPAYYPFPFYGVPQPIHLLGLRVAAKAIARPSQRIPILKDAVTLLASLEHPHDHRCPRVGFTLACYLATLLFPGRTIPRDPPPLPKKGPRKKGALSLRERRGLRVYS